MPHTKYIWDPLSDNVLMEKDENGDTNATNTYLPEQYGDIISQRRDGETSYYHFDGQGSTRALTDANEEVSDTYTYTAFGEEVSRTGTTENPYRYVGEKGYYFDEETEDYYVRARNYEPAIGRWLSRDPLEFLAGLNMFRYSGNDPVDSRDPTGLIEGTGKYQDCDCGPGWKVVNVCITRYWGIQSIDGKTAVDLIKAELRMANEIYEQCCIKVQSTGKIPEEPKDEDTTIRILGKDYALDLFTKIGTPSEEENRLTNGQTPVDCVHVYYVYRLDRPSDKETPNPSGQSYWTNAFRSPPAPAIARGAAARRDRNPNILAHELGHILLNTGGHGSADGDQNNIMIFPIPAAARMLSEKQCDDMRKGNPLLKDPTS